MAWKRARIGDVCEIRTPAGLAYVQFTHAGGDMGELVRVLPGLYSSRPFDFTELTKQKELFFTFYALNYALRDMQTEVVSHQPVPVWARRYPMMRRRGLEDKNGKTLSWKIGDASKRSTIEELKQMPTVVDLTPEQSKMSIRALWTHPVLVKKLAQGWTPQKDEELRQRDRLAAEKQQPLKADPARQSMRHYLYFAKKRNAEQAGQELRERGFWVDVRRGADGENWLAYATHQVPGQDTEMETLRDYLESLAAKLDGEYDGWELVV